MILFPVNLVSIYSVMAYFLQSTLRIAQESQESMYQIHTIAD